MSPTKAKRARAPHRAKADYIPPSAEKQREKGLADLGALLARPEIRSALRHCENMQLTHDSIVRKLAGGSQAVTVKDLDAELQHLTASRRSIFDLAQQHPLLIGHPSVPVTRP